MLVTTHHISSEYNIMNKIKSLTYKNKRIFFKYNINKFVSYNVYHTAHFFDSVFKFVIISLTWPNSTLNSIDRCLPQNTLPLKSIYGNAGEDIP